MGHVLVNTFVLFWCAAHLLMCTICLFFVVPKLDLWKCSKTYKNLYFN